MKKNIIVIIIILLSICRLNSTSILSDIEPGTRLDFINGNGYWDISFPAGTLTDGTEVKGVSSLKYDSLNNYCFVAPCSLVL